MKSVNIFTRDILTKMEAKLVTKSNTCDMPYNTHTYTQEIIFI